MISFKDVLWTTDDQVVSEQKSNNTVRVNASKAGNFPAKKLRKKKTSPSRTEYKMSADTLVTLKDLNEEDKQKIAQLIKELAKAGEEKETVMRALDEERQKFVHQLREMEDERLALMGKQNLMAAEVEQCQQLLQYYQNLISMQQANIQAHEDSKLQNTSRPHNKTSSKRSVCSSPSGEFLSSDDLKVEEVSETQDSDVTNDEDIMQMSSRRYKDFLCQKKEKLKKEQKLLRKMLIEAGESLENTRLSPVRLKNGHIPTHLASPKHRSTQIDLTSLKSPPLLLQSRSSVSPTEPFTKKNLDGAKTRSAQTERDTKSPPVLLQEDDPISSQNRHISHSFVSAKNRSVQTDTNFCPPETPPALLRRHSPRSIRDFSMEPSPKSGKKFQRTTTPEKILSLLSDDQQRSYDSQRSYSWHTPPSDRSLHICESNLGRLTFDDMSSVYCDDDTQLLQEIFFVN